MLASLVDCNVCRTRGARIEKRVEERRRASAMQASEQRRRAETRERVKSPQLLSLSSFSLTLHYRSWIDFILLPSRLCWRSILESCMSFFLSHSSGCRLVPGEAAQSSVAFAFASPPLHLRPSFAHKFVAKLTPLVMQSLTTLVGKERKRNMTAIAARMAASRRKERTRVKEGVERRASTF